MASLQSSLVRLLFKYAVNWNKPVEEVRMQLQKMDSKTKLPDSADYQKTEFYDVKGEWITPKELRSEKIILYIHGGGNCIGIVNTNRKYIAQIALEAGMKLFLPDFRLAPEFPFPAALNDCIKAYLYLLELGFQSDKIVIVADSSGCGLSLSMMNFFQEEGVPLPVSVHFFCPMLDSAKTGESMISRAKKDPYRLKPEFFYDRLYVAENDPCHPSISPLYADLKNLPPVFIHAADYDVFLSDAIRLHDKLLSGSSPSTLKIWPKMWHNFQMSADILPEGKIAIKEAVSFF